MSDWQEFKADAGRFFDKATKEAVKLGDTATLYVKIKNIELKLDEEYSKLGKIYYRTLKQNAENDEQTNAQLKVIENFEASAAALRAELDRLKDQKK